MYPKPPEQVNDGKHHGKASGKHRQHEGDQAAAFVVLWCVGVKNLHVERIAGALPDCSAHTTEKERRHENSSTLG